MKYLLLIIITTCNTYSGIVISNNEFSQTSEVKINQAHYIVVSGYYPLNDTLIISKDNLRVINKR